MLKNPNAKELMGIAVSVGLAQNFAALRSLVTTGIQKGHMRMHLLNILNQLQASEEEKQRAIKYFENNTVSYKAVRDFMSTIRNYH
jgi:hydroxymethylglutaryl-CoA reductase